MAGVERRWFPVFIKYPVYPEPRFGYNGLETHPFLYEIINRNKDAYKLRLLDLMKYRDDFLRIPTEAPDNPCQPFWNNPWFSGLDAMALYGFIATVQPKLYLEIGSGNSTTFARQAVSDHHLQTRMVSIDPHPRKDIDSLADEIVRSPLERTDLAIFDRLTKNDILFFDGSHRCFMNSDVTVFFLEVLPRLPSGILIHIHDIHLPYDYPPERALHYESEQYLLATMLLGGCSKYEIVLPNKFVMNDENLCNCMGDIWHLEQSIIPKRETSLWLRKT